MKRKILTAFLSLAGVMVCALGFAACDGNTDGDKCEHVYNNYEIANDREHIAYCGKCENNITEEHDFSKGDVCVCGYENGKNPDIPEEPDSALYFELNSDGGSYSVTGVRNGYDISELIIPAEYNRKPVTAIGSSAFENCIGLTSIIIPEGVVSINDKAFGGCSGLTDIVISDGVMDIGSYAFSGCPIETATIPAFACQFIRNDNLKTIVIKNGGSIVDRALENCRELTSITMIGDVVGIGQYAFRNCNSLESVIISNEVMIIGSGAFSGCGKLESIVIPNGVSSIDYQAFYNCSSLKSITIPDSVTSVGPDAFSGTAWYEQQPDGIIYAGQVAYKYKGIMPENTSVILKDGTFSITDSAFEGCTGLTSVTIPESVNIIIGAFVKCSNLETVYWNAVDCRAAVDSDGGRYKTAFDGTNLKTVIFGNKVANIHAGTFYGCDAIESMYYTGNIAGWCGIIGLNNLDLSKVYINNQKLQEMTSVTIPDGVTVINDYAFSDCRSLTSVTIPGSVKIIYGYAFFNCRAIESVYYTGDIAGWCKVIRYSSYLVSSNTSLYINGNKISGELIIPDGITSITYSAFAGCKGLTSVTISDSVKSIDDFAFGGCKDLTSVTISDSVTKIDDYAFDGCVNLTDITFNGTIAQWNAIEKNDYWDAYMGDYTVHCTDGDIDKG